MFAAARRSLGFMSRRERVFYYLLVALRSLVGLLDVVGIFLIGFVAAVGATQLSGPSGSTQPVHLLGFEIPRLTTQQMLPLVLIVLAVFLIKATVAILFSRLLTSFVATIEVRSAQALANFILRGSLEATRKHTRADLQYAITDSASWAFTGILNNVASIISESFLLTVVAITFIVVDPVVAILAFLYFALVIIGMQLFIGQRLKRAGTQSTVGSVETIGALTDTLDTFRELSVLAKQDLFIRRIARARKTVAHSGATLTFLGGMPRYVIETALIFGVVLFVGIQLVTGDLAAGLATLGVFLAGGVRIMGSLLPLQTAVAALKINAERALPAHALLAELRDAKVEPASESEPERTTPPPAARGLAVSLRDVDYRYLGDSGLTLAGISLEVEAGSFTAVVGPSGAGKTTLVDLILGLALPVSGSVRIGGIEPRALRVSGAGLVAYVPQKPGLVAGSIAENIALGIEPSEIDYDRVHEVVDAAFLSDFLATLPDGIHSSVGKHADALSGGQIQRIGLARALYVRPRLLVLDEATSGLDAASEAYISEGLRALHGEVTTIVIAHRLSTVQHADVVHVVEAGRIVASGDFKTVRATVPMVAEYVKLMSFDEVEEVEVEVTEGEA